MTYHGLHLTPDAIAAATFCAAALAIVLTMCAGGLMLAYSTFLKDREPHK